MATINIVSGFDELETITHAHTAAVVDGDALVVNGKLCIALQDADADEAITWAVAGRAEAPKAAALAIAAGASVYWNAGNGEITTTATANTACGYAMEAAAGADTTVYIRLRPAA